MLETIALVEDKRHDSDEGYHARANMILKANLEITEDDVKKDLGEWQLDTGCQIELLKYEVMSSDEKHHIAKALIRFVVYELQHYDIVESPFYDEFWNRCMKEIIEEGVCYSKSKIPDDLRDSLRKNIDKLADETEIDYHPNSNDVVRNLVHPALFSYIEGVSTLQTPDLDPPKAKKEKRRELDFWGRLYEDSKFQWLPSSFYISPEGKCSIKEYINNLEKDKFPELYTDLERLFEVFLSYFEEVWSYAKAVEFGKVEDSLAFVEFDNSRKIFDFTKPEIKFRDQELQVITKIVDYTLQPGQSYEGVWHAEGMSHENIVMTGKI